MAQPERMTAEELCRLVRAYGDGVVTRQEVEALPVLRAMHAFGERLREGQETTWATGGISSDSRPAVSGEIEIGPMHFTLRPAVRAAPAMKRHFVTFYSPGTTETCEVASWDPALAVQAEIGVEGYAGARTHFFDFSTRERGEQDLDSRVVARSAGKFFLGGRLKTLDEVEERADPKESGLSSYMRGSDEYIVCVAERGWKGIQAFGVHDVIVDAVGKITERGDDPKYVAYRAKVKARFAAVV